MEEHQQLQHQGGRGEADFEVSEEDSCNQGSYCFHLIARKKQKHQKEEGGRKEEEGGDNCNH